MKTQGSITIFFTLLLSIIFSMLGSLLLSAKMAAGRVQIATAADQTLYSAMAKYDKQLFEEYHLLYMDGGYGTGTLQLGNTLDEMETDLSYILTPNKERRSAGGVNFLQLEKISGAISGYTLATDCQGNVFWEQVVSYMKETLGLQGVASLTEKLQEENGILRSQKDQKKNIEKEGTVEDYEDLKEKDTELEEGEGQEVEIQLDPETEKIGTQTRDTMDLIADVKKSAVLQFVLPNDTQISSWSADKTALLRNRSVQAGMGYLELTITDRTAAEELLFQEYIMQNINFYGSKKHDTGQAYGIEWILFEQLSDAENLEKSVHQLFFMREAANAATLYQDTVRRGEVTALASALAAVLKIPGAKTVLEAAIILAWAYAESVVDVSSMLRGKRVSLVKDRTGWQVEFTDIGAALQEPDKFYKESYGMNYQDYLRVLLLAKSREKRITGCMEVIELSVREISGKEGFSMDCAIDSLEAVFEIRVQDYMTFNITEKRSYRTM